jgi:hypothetical protein
VRLRAGELNSHARLKKAGDKLAYKDYVSFDDLLSRMVVSKQFELITRNRCLIRFAGNSERITVIGEDGSHAVIIPEDKVGVMQGKVWTKNGPNRYPNDPFRRMVSRTNVGQKVLLYSDDPVTFDTWEEKAFIFGADKIDAMNCNMFNKDRPQQYQIEGGDIIVIYTIERGHVPEWKMKQIVIRSRVTDKDDEAVLWLEHHLGDKQIEKARILAERWEREQPTIFKVAQLLKEKKVEEARIEAIRVEEENKVKAAELREAEKIRKAEETTWRFIRRRHGDRFEFKGKTYVVHDHTVYLFMVGGKKISLDKAKQIGLFEAWHESLAHYAKGAS